VGQGRPEAEAARPAAGRQAGAEPSAAAVAVKECYVRARVCVSDECVSTRGCKERQGRSLLAPRSVSATVSSGSVGDARFASSYYCPNKSSAAFIMAFIIAMPIVHPRYLPCRQEPNADRPN
jgi:hypothetical protein